MLKQLPIAIAIGLRAWAGRRRTAAADRALPLAAPRRRAGAGARGMSIVELMVGVTVGMLVVAGALQMYVGHITSSRKLLVQARVTQDLRAAMDLMARDLRRAGYWGNALQGTRAMGAGSSTAQNPYAQLAHTGLTQVTYGFSRGSENDALDDAERFGFRVHEGALQMQTTSGNWKDVTDVRSVVITEAGLSMEVSETALPLGHLCATACPAGTPNCPSTTLRTVNLSLTGRAVGDSRVVRTVRDSVRLRNDRLAGQCPA